MHLKRLLWVFLSAFLFHSFCSVEGYMCRRATNDSSQFTCPSLCFGNHCTSEWIQSYHSVNKTASLVGCFGDGFSLSNSTTALSYVERHVIYSASQLGKIYLNLAEDATSKSVHSTNIEYDFMLFSDPQTTWVVFYNEDSKAKYNFYVSEDSQVVGYQTGQKIYAAVVPVYVKTVRGMPYIPLQIHKQVCDAFKWNHKPSPLTSLVNIGDANSIHVALRTSTASENRKICDFRRTSNGGFQGSAHNVQSALLLSLPVSSSCKGKVMWSEVMSGVHVVDIFNNTGNTTVEVELVGAPVNNEATVVVLRSSRPVAWFVGGSGLKTSNISFVISSESDFTSKLPLLDQQSVSRKDFSGQGVDFLISVISFLNIPISSYTKFVGSPDLVKLALHRKRQKIAGPPERPSRKFFEMLHASLKVNARVDSELFVECALLKKYSVDATDLVIGNGLCVPQSLENGILYTNLIRCGLIRETWNVFKIRVAVGNYGEEIYFLIPKNPSSITVYNDIRMKKESFKMQIVDKTRSTFYVKAELSTFVKHNISSKLDHCYIENENYSIKLNLIQENCPVGGYTSFLAHRRRHDNAMSFILSFDSLLESHQYGIYKLVCVLSKCFKPHPDLKSSSALPQCPVESNKECEFDDSVHSSPYFERLKWSFNLARPAKLSTVSTATLPTTTDNFDSTLSLPWIIVLVMALFLLIFIFITVMLISFYCVGPMAFCKQPRSRNRHPRVRVNEALGRNRTDESISLNQYWSVPQVTHDRDTDNGVTSVKSHDEPQFTGTADLSVGKVLCIPLLPSGERGDQQSASSADSGVAEKECSEGSFVDFNKSQYPSDGCALVYVKETDL